MEYKISKGERALVLWIISQLPGVNRTDARLVSKVREHMLLEEVENGIPKKEIEDTSAIDLAELEVAWVLDHINKMFEASKVPPMISDMALSLEDKFRESAASD